MLISEIFSLLNVPELVPDHTVDQKVSSGDKTKEDMRDIAKEMVPHGEPFTNIAFLYTGPAAQGDNNQDEVLLLPGSVYYDDIIHHDDNPGETTDNENDGNHDKNNGQSLFTCTLRRSNQI